MQKVWQKIVAALGCILVAAFAAFLLVAKTALSLPQIVLIAVAVGTFLYLAILRSRLFLPLLSAALACVIAVNVFTLFTGPETFHIHRTRSQSWTGLPLEGEHFVELALPAFLDGKTVITDADARFAYVIESFAQEMVVEDISLSPDTLATADAQYPLWELNLISTIYEREEYTRNRGTVSFWMEGLEEADTVVILDDGYYNMYVMSEATYRMLQEEEENRA